MRSKSGVAPSPKSAPPRGRIGESPERRPSLKAQNRAFKVSPSLRPVSWPLANSSAIFASADPGEYAVLQRDVLVTPKAGRLGLELEEKQEPITR
jgi:hypothetical protein